MSSYNQAHKFTGNWKYDLPFGDSRRFLNKGALSHVIGGWQWSGDFTIASGLYYTPRVMGASLDIARGVSGSLRANVVAGESIQIANPTTAGRNIILGPAQFTFNMAMSKTITIRETRALELRLQASNIFNTPYFSGLNTAVNSLQFGQITGVANMRRITMVARFRF